MKSIGGGIGTVKAAKRGIDKKARRLCTHQIVYTKFVDMLVVARSMQGMSTKAIANETGLSESCVQYRILKAQHSVNLKFRADYRNGDGPLVARMLKSTEKVALDYISDVIAPQFVPLARQGVPRQ